jgi:uncharacterized RDD family membrane protein YckC
MYQSAPRAPLWRRLAAMMYDVMALIALMMLAMGLALMVVKGLQIAGVLATEGYIDTADYVQKHAIWFQLYLIVGIFSFYVYFWSKAGQTLGMRAWRLLLVNQDGTLLKPSKALLRSLLALAGLGNLWLIIRFGKGLALQDQLTDSQMIVLTKEQSSLRNLHKEAR